MPPAVTLKLTLSPVTAFVPVGCAVMRRYSDEALDAHVIRQTKTQSGIIRNRSIRVPIADEILLAVNVALAIVAIFNPLMNHSTVLPVLLIITSRHAKPTEPAAIEPVCCA